MPDSTSTPPRDDFTLGEMLSAIEAASHNVDREYRDRALTCIEGEVPRDLAGAFYRNGPGRLERGGVRYNHPFDGDGHVVRLAFEQGCVRYTNRFVRTQPFVEEEAAGRMLYRSFGTNLPGGLRGNLLRMPIKNTANTNLVYHGGKLLALWEAGLPHRLDPVTLETLGTEDYAGRLRNPFSRIERAFAPNMPFSAHPCLDEDTGELFNFGVLFGKQHRLMLYRVSPEGAMAQPRTHDLPRFSFIHDFQLTRRYLVFLIPDADFDVPRTLLGLATLAGSLRLRPERALQILLIPRDGGAATTLEAGNGFVFHIAHGYDRDDGRVVLEVCRYREYPAFDRLEALFAPDGPAGIAHLERIVVDPQSGRCESFPLSPRPAELPRVAPGSFGRPARWIYSIGAPAGRRAPYYTTMQRLDTDTGEMLVHEFHPDLVGEPMIVTGGNGEPDWLLTLVYRTRSRRTDLVVLRTADLGLQALVALPHSVPPGFHGCWLTAEPKRDGENT